MHERLYVVYPRYPEDAESVRLQLRQIYGDHATIDPHSPEGRPFFKVTVRSNSAAELGALHRAVESLARVQAAVEIDA